MEKQATPGMMMEMTSPPTDLDDPELLGVLDRARSLGFLGPGPLRVHLEHSARYDAAIRRSLAPPDNVAEGTWILDLGSGGGLPGLPLAYWRSDYRVVLVEAGQRRCDFLRSAIDELRLSATTQVAEGRAESLARSLGLRGRFDVVVSRGFGPPALTLECAVAFVKDGGRILISEPPSRRLWPSLDLDGLRVDYSAAHPGLAAFSITGDPRASKYPRALRTMRRSPLFEFD
jgi:hypothetical protein